MKTTFFLSCLLLWGLGCRETSEASKPEPYGVREEPKTKSLDSTIVLELLEFADLDRNDGTLRAVPFSCWEIDATNGLVAVDIERATELYRKLMRSGRVPSLPIFEIPNTDLAILPLQGAGFGGAIWATVLLDRNTLEIKKIAFGHQSESEDYGAGISKESFGDRFVGRKVDLDTDTFTLHREVERINDSGQPIDGLSGATVTSQGVVQMINEGMKEYRKYLRPEGL